MEIVDLFNVRDEILLENTLSQRKDPKAYTHPIISPKHQGKGMKYICAKPVIFQLI